MNAAEIEKEYRAFLYEPECISKLVEKYRDIDKIEGWMHVFDLHFLYTVARMIPWWGKVVELGSWKGRSTAAIMKGLLEADKNRNIKEFRVIDLWKGTAGEPENAYRDTDNACKTFSYNMLSRFGCVPDIIIMDTFEAAQIFKEESFDMIFIDADHSTEGVTKDISAWWPKLKIGGIMAGHDYKKESVRIAVENIFVHHYPRPEDRDTADRPGELKVSIGEIWYVIKEN